MVRKRLPGRLALIVPLALLAITAPVSTSPFFAPGRPATVDVWPHLTRQQIVYEALKGGFSPFYTFMLYCGFPALRFYSPLFYFLGGLFTLLTAGNLMLALRAFLLIAHSLSAWAMFTLLGRRTDEQAGATLDALAFLLAGLLHVCRPLLAGSDLDHR